MPMVCPQCNRTFGQHISCPECGGRLLFQAGMHNSVFDDNSPGDGARWQQTPWGRMAVGLILAQGLAYGLQQLVTAGFLATGEEASLWTTIGGMVLFQCLQGICMLIGGALCGAGRQLGILYGSLIGLASGLILLVWQRPGSTVLTEIAIYSQPILHLAFGALGGFIGTLIWKPIPVFQVVEPTGDNKSVNIAAPSLPFLAGPVHLGRVCLGVCVVVNGVVWSNAILNWVINASQGSFEIRTHLQAQLIGWEVCALASLIGAGLAGSNTFNGLKHGLCVGVGSSLILIGVFFGNPKSVLESSVLTIIGVIVLTITGGWFGAQLFPPLQAARRRKRILTG
jgi:hypothetical protein